MPIADSGAALFAGSGHEFIQMAPSGRLTMWLEHAFEQKIGTPTESEVRSWSKSLAAMSKVLAGADLDASGVGVEVRLPLTSKRLDVSLVGRNLDGEPTTVVVELKQWDAAQPSLFPGNVQVGGYELLHPSVQSGSYADYLRESHSAFTEDGFRIQGCAYLHEMSQAAAAQIRSRHYRDELIKAPLFVRGEESDFQNLLIDSVGGGDGVALLPSLVNGRYRPSIKLLDGIAKALTGSPIWTLLDEQRVAFNTVKGLVQQCVKEGNKAVVVVTGGPGTGKSVIAAHLVTDLARELGCTAAHSTASKAMTTNLRALGPAAASALFAWNKDFAHTKVKENCVDLLVLDEAHRVRQTSNTQYTPARQRSTIPQAYELVRAARVAVFLLDERQSVRKDEVGTAALIREAAEAYSAAVHRIDLDAQFRCNGCDAYIEWVGQLLSSTPASAGAWYRNGEYRFEIFDSAEALENAVHAEAKAGGSARLVAGFCWPWSDPLPDGRLKADVRIGDWARPWNEKSREQTKKKGATPKPDKHPYYLWANRHERISEIGCIYSAQGFEFDCCGVIMGPDLVWRAGQGWVAQKSASCDSAIVRSKWADGELVARLQQIYRVLLTRGVESTFVYSTDEETRSFLMKLLR